MISFTLSDSIKRIISDTLNDSFDKLINNETVISSMSSKLDFKIKLEDDGEVRSLPVEIKKLDNLKNEVKYLLPEMVYITDVKFIK